MSAPVSAAGVKKPVNRKLLYLLLAALTIIWLAGMALMWIQNPQQQKQAEVEQEQQERIAAMPAGSPEAAQSELERIAREQERQAAAEERQRQAFDNFRNGGQEPAAANGLDPHLLRELDEAQRAVMGNRPDVGRMTGDALPPLSGVEGAGGGGLAVGGEQQKGVIYESYRTRSAGGVAQSVGEDLFGGDEAGDGEGSAPRPEMDYYETLRPARAPSERIIHQGTPLPAVLVSRVDTRVPGPITAVISRNVYDSRTHRVLLIPQGSKLVGSYATNVTPGVDRIAVSFSRLILPNGDAFDLPSIPSVGLDGTAGVEGNYKSNFWRAVGPSVLVAILGQAADRAIAKELEATDSTVPGVGGTYQAPSVLQQTMPKVNEAILQRYAGAQPYFVIPPGQEIRVVVTRDIEVPATRGAP